MNWLEEMAGVARPVIAMVHLRALPGAPRFDAAGGVAGIIEHARRDLEALQAGGVDAVMFCNENDRPYVFQVDRVTLATFAAVVSRLRPEVSVPFGIDVLWDPLAALAIARAVGARFVREVFTGTYDSDMGLWSPSAGAAQRYRRQIGADDVRLLYNINAEFASSLGGRSLAEVARSVAFSSLPDAICVSGPMTGQPVEVEHLRQVRAAIGDIPLIANTGVGESNLPDLARWVDGFVVGTSLKVDGVTWNPVDPARVRGLMAVARAARAQS